MTILSHHRADPRGGPDDERSFVELAVCRGRTSLFFPGHNERPSARARREARAKELCAGCPVAQSCRDYGRRHAEYGLWGGETEEERVLAGVELTYPYSPRTVQRLLDERAASAPAVAAQPLAMPLAELVDPSVPELEATATWIAEVLVDDPAAVGARRTSSS